MEKATPVGTSFMSRFTDFEVDEGAALGGDAGGGTSFPEPAIPASDDHLLGEDGLDADFDEGEPAAEPAAEAEAWAGPSQQEWQETQEALGQFAQLMEYLQAEPEAPAGPPEPSIFERAAAGEVDLADPETFQSAIRAEAERLMEERFGPYQPILEAQAQQQGEAMVHEALDAIAKDMGEFDRNHALIATQSLLANGVPPEQAFRQAAAITRQFEERTRAAAIEEYKKSLGNLEDVEPEPLGGGAARESEQYKVDPHDPDKYERVAQRFMERKRAAERAAQTG